MIEVIAINSHVCSEVQIAKVSIEFPKNITADTKDISSNQIEIGGIVSIKFSDELESYYANYKIASTDGEVARLELHSWLDHISNCLVYN